MREQLMVPGVGTLSHDALARSLADHLRGPDRMVWCDLQLGPSGSPRPDVYTIFKSFVRPTPMAYECKVSVSDFRFDITTGKWQTYLPFASGVYFACEAGLIFPRDVPEHCGLIVRHPDSGAWRAAKKATLRAVTVPQDALLKLLIDGVEREGPRYRGKPYLEALYLHRLADRFGDIAARTIRDRLVVEQEIEDRQRQATRIIEDATHAAAQLRKEAAEELGPLRVELCEVLGLPAESNNYTLQHEVRRLRDSLAEHPAIEKHRRLTEAIRNRLDWFGYKAPVSAPADSECET